MKTCPMLRLYIGIKVEVSIAELGYKGESRKVKLRVALTDPSVPIADIRARFWEHVVGRRYQMLTDFGAADLTGIVEMVTHVRSSSTLGQIAVLDYKIKRLVTQVDSLIRHVERSVSDAS